MTDGLLSESDADHLRRWIGRSETTRDEIVAAQIAAMSATIDRIDAVQGGISEGLKVLTDLTSAIHLQLSLLQRPGTLPVAAE